MEATEQCPFSMKLHPHGGPVLKCQFKGCFLPHVLLKAVKFTEQMFNVHARMPRRLASKPHTRADDAHDVEWAHEVLGKEMQKGSVMGVLHSLSGHPLSGKQWMKMTNETSIDDLGFSTTTHD